MIFKDWETFSKEVNVNAYYEIKDEYPDAVPVIKELLERGWKIEVPAKDLVSTYTDKRGQA